MDDGRCGANRGGSAWLPRVRTLLGRGHGLVVRYLRHDAGRPGARRPDVGRRSCRGGLVSAARWLPYLVFGVFAGVFVDRARRRPILVATDFVRCVLLVAIPTLAVVHHLSLVVLVAFMIVFGSASLAERKPAGHVLAGHYGSRGCRFDSCRARVWLRQSTGPDPQRSGPCVLYGPAVRAVPMPSGSGLVDAAAAADRAEGPGHGQGRALVRRDHPQRRRGRLARPGPAVSRARYDRPVQ